MDQIQAMRIFARVVEAGTFTRAADSLQMPKASVTKNVQALEERLRVKLLNRTTRRVTVTADGAAYYDRAVRLLADFDDLEASVSQARTTPRGRLRVDGNHRGASAHHSPSERVPVPLPRDTDRSGRERPHRGSDQ